MLKDFLLVAGLLLATSTQLRFPGLPIGPGEFSLAIWLLIGFSGLLFRLNAPIPPAVIRLFVFWTLFGVSLSVGLMVAYVIGDSHDSSLVLHDLIAYTLVASIVFFTAIEPDAQTRSHEICWLLVGLGAMFILFQLLHASTSLVILDIDPWYYHRLRGWSENSNALAMCCLALSLISIHLVETSPGLKQKLLASICAVPPILAGILTDSDAFKLAFAVGLLVLLVLKAWNILFAKVGARSFISLSATAALLAIPIVVLATTPLAWKFVTGGGSGGVIVSAKKSTVLKSDAQDRFQLWGQAVNRAFESGMLGLGPGPHLGMPREHRLPSKEPNTDLAPPPPDFEAHNTLLDLLVQGGLLAALSILWLGAVTAMTSLKAGKPVLVALLFAIAAFSTTHLVIRVPIVWFVIAVCLVTTGSGRYRSQSLTPERLPARPVMRF